MANRVLLGEHATYDYGLFISKPGVDVTGANKNYFLFDTNSASMGQLLVFERVTVNPGLTYDDDFNNFGRNTFGLLYDSQGLFKYGITFAASMQYISLSITKTNNTTSNFALHNSSSGINSVVINAAVIIFAENI